MLINANYTIAQNCTYITHTRYLYFLQPCISGLPSCQYSNDLRWWLLLYTSSTSCRHKKPLMEPVYCRVMYSYTIFTFIRTNLLYVKVFWVNSHISLLISCNNFPIWHMLPLLIFCSQVHCPIVYLFWMDNCSLLLKIHN